MLKMPGAHPSACPLQFLSLEKAALLIYSDLILPGYKCLVMKNDKITHVRKFWKSPLQSIILSFIHIKLVHSPGQDIASHGKRYPLSQRKEPQ